VNYGEPLGTDRMATNAVRAYKPVRDAHDVRQVKPGDRLPLTGMQVDVVSACGELIDRTLAGGGETVAACARAEDQPEDGTENYRSVGLMFELGAFRFLARATGGTLRASCPPTGWDRRRVSSRITATTIRTWRVRGIAAARHRAQQRPRQGGSLDAFRTLRARRI
jgi:hypothetical protein